MKFILLCFVLWTTVSSAQTLHLLEPEHVSLEYVNYNQAGLQKYYPFHAGVRDTYLAPLDEELTFGLGINMNYNLIRYKELKLFHRNHWGFDSAQSHVRHVFWKFNLGINLNDRLEIYHDHMSRHVLEDVRPVRFPVRDSLNIRLIIMER